MNRLKTSVASGALRIFYHWLRLANNLGMDEIVKEYSTRFIQRVLLAKKNLINITIKNHEYEKIKYFLIEGSKLGLETEMTSAIQHIRQLVLIFVHEVSEHDTYSANKGSTLSKQELRPIWKSEGVKLGAHILKSVLHALQNYNLLENTRIQRSIIGLFRCNWIGFPLSSSYGKQGAFTSMKTMISNFHIISRR